MRNDPAAAQPSEHHDDSSCSSKAKGEQQQKQQQQQQESWSSSADEEVVDRLIETTRKELQRLQEHRTTTLKNERAEELKGYQCALSKKQKSLRTKLLLSSTTTTTTTTRTTTRPHHQSSSSSSTQPYITVLRELHSQSSNKDLLLPPSMVLRLEASLLQAMHLTFLVYPTQQALIHRSHDEFLSDYLNIQQEECTLEKQRVDQRLVETVSSVAQENHRLYDSYQDRLDELQREITIQLLSASSSSSSCSMMITTTRKELKMLQEDDDDDRDDKNTSSSSSTLDSTSSNHSESSMSSSSNNHEAFSSSSSSSSSFSWWNKLHDSVSSFAKNSEQHWNKQLEEQSQSPQEKDDPISLLSSSSGRPYPSDHRSTSRHEEPPAAYSLSAAKQPLICRL